MSTITDISKSALYLKYHKLMERLNHVKDEDLDEMVHMCLDEIEEKGYVVVPNFWSVDQCTQARKQIDSIITNHPDHIWIDPEGADKRVWGVEGTSTLFGDYNQNHFIRKVTQKFYKTDVKYLISMANKITPTDGNLGSGNGWHRDSVHQKQLKSILYLSDVKEQNGPFQYLVGTQNESSIYKTIKNCGITFAQNRFSESDIDKILNTDLYNLHTLTGTVGTLVLADTFGIHRGKPIEEGSRYAVTNYFFSAVGLKDKNIERFEELRLPN